MSDEQEEKARLKDAVQPITLTQGPASVWRSVGPGSTGATQSPRIEG